MSQAWQEEEALGKAYDTRLLRLLWSYVKPYSWQVAATLLMVGPLFIIELAPAWIIKSGLDHVFVAEGTDTGDRGIFGWIFDSPLGIAPMYWLAILYLLFAVAGAAMNFAHMLLMATTGQSAMRDLRRVVFDKVQSLHVGFFDRYPVGRLVTRVTNDIENVAEMFSAGVVALITDVFKMVGFAVALFLVAPDLALVTFVMIPFLAVAAIIFRFKVREAFRSVRVRIALINAHIQESITGMKVVQLFTRESRNMDDFAEMNAAHRDAWQQSIRYEAILFAAVELASGVTIAVIIWYGTGLADPGVLYVFIDWMRRFFMPLRDLSAKYSVMQSSMASSERIFQLLETPVAIPDPEVPATLPERSGPNGSTGSVEFEHVWFAYNEGEWIIRDLCFRVAPGEKVAFVGASGAGKTTIINLMTRMYDVGRGRILLDGIDIRDIPQHQLRRRVATVLQDVFLFSGSIRDNISLERPDLSEGIVEQAARAVQAHDFIVELPNGYETEVRERGSNFSAGQRQLLSFARALAHGADVLILDEATSSIDSETEELIQQGIRVLMEGKTAIAIAHRLSTIRGVDRIYVLHKGELVESGHHDELMARQGAYFRLHSLQAELQGTSVPPAEALSAP